MNNFCVSGAIMVLQLFSSIFVKASFSAEQTLMIAKFFHLTSEEVDNKSSQATFLKSSFTAGDTLKRGSNI